MNQHSPVARTPRKTIRAAKKAAPARLQSIASTARKAAGTVSRAGARAAEPLVASLKQEEPETLAKMAVAALAPILAPRLAVAALRFVVRNPLIVATGALAFAAAVAMTDESEAAAS
ncbi:hypothetical protein [Sphingobium nicotianae]|uniref:Uncharacterized protein n=1 Tax=Sphingobium nicotianae TaxID=2782607 RepID=A0A9X1IRI8_9SPHN|nr:hypothetical protein [Sphingobium nicotianae]MBT2187483.1 hypothetical protein [Sphingobium nicotianae]